MALELSESVGFAAETTKGNKWRVKVIESGWGSSGYYPSEVLRQYGPVVFKKGTKVFMNHPSFSESNDRPERDVHQLAGKLVSDATFAENGLVAEIEFYSHYAPIIKEMFEDVGLSIHAFGEASVGEAEGREGPIIESLVPNPLTSVDVVTVAGAGGKFLNLLESYKNKDETIEINEIVESVSEGNESMMENKEVFEAAMADLKLTLVEAIAPLQESISVLLEAATPAEVEETDETAEEVVESIDPVEVAVKFNESGLPALALKRIAEALKSETNEKSVEDLITEEKAYVSQISESTATANDTFGVIEEAATYNANDEYEAILSRITKK